MAYRISSRSTSCQLFVCPWIRMLLISLFFLFDTVCASTGITSSVLTNASHLPTSACSRSGNAASAPSLTHTLSSNSLVEHLSTFSPQMLGSFNGGMDRVVHCVFIV